MTVDYTLTVQIPGYSTRCTSRHLVLQYRVIQKITTTQLSKSY